MVSSVAPEDPDHNPFIVKYPEYFGRSNVKEEFHLRSIRSTEKVLEQDKFGLVLSWRRYEL